jgi:hypothetical protein
VTDFSTAFLSFPSRLRWYYSVRTSLDEPPVLAVFFAVNFRLSRECWENAFTKASPRSSHFPFWSLHTTQQFYHLIQCPFKRRHQVMPTSPRKGDFHTCEVGSMREFGIIIQQYDISKPKLKVKLPLCFFIN